MVLLADVRSVGVQGDGRTYGHPVVLRPVSSEDAMTADWTRLPYDVLARISTRITNEVSEVNRVVLDVTSQAARAPSSGSRSLQRPPVPAPMTASRLPGDSARPRSGAVTPADCPVRLWRHPVTKVGPLDLPSSR